MCDADMSDYSTAWCMQLNGVRRGIQSNKVTRSGLCHVVYDGQGRDMLVYQLCSPPVPRGRFHELHDLPAWLVPLTYQDIILDLKERFPYLEVTSSHASLHTLTLLLVLKA